MSSPTLIPEPARTRPGGISRREASAIAALTVFALLLRVTSLSRSLFTDEAYSLALAQRGFGHMLSLFGYEANGAPYPIVLWPLIRIFGSGEAVLRLPSVLAGTASVPALWWAARRFASVPAALLAAGLLAINPMAIWYSQQARPYAFVMLAACLAFGTLPRAVEGAARPRTWIAYVAAMVALAYCDILAAPLVLPAQALIVRRSGREGFRRWLRALVAVLVFCIPLLVAAAISRSRRNAFYWLPKTDRELVELALQEFTAGFSNLTAVRWATVGVVAVLVGAALWSVRRARARAAGDALAIALCWGVLPAAVLLAISFVEPVFWPRYAILSLPGLALAVALAAQVLWRSRRGVMVVAGCLAVVVVAAAAADARQRTHLQEDWPPVGAWLRAERAPGQPTIVDNALVLPTLGYYYPAFRARDGDVIVQEWHDRALPPGFVGFKDPSGYGSVPDGPPSVATFRGLAGVGGGTIWMIVSEVDSSLQADPRKGEAVAWARSHCRVDVRETIGVWVLRATGCPR